MSELTSEPPAKVKVSEILTLPKFALPWNIFASSSTGNLTWST